MDCEHLLYHSFSKPKVPVLFRLLIKDNPEQKVEERHRKHFESTRIALVVDQRIGEGGV